MSTECSIFERKEFTAIHARLVNDPPAFWRNQKLYITVYRGDTAKVELSEEDLQSCERLANKKKVTVDVVIKALKLDRAGLANYQELNKANLIPINPEITDTLVAGNKVYINVTPKELSGKSLTREEKEKARATFPELPKEEAKEKYLAEKLARRKFDKLVLLGTLPLHAEFAGEYTQYLIERVKRGELTVGYEQEASVKLLKEGKANLQLNRSPTKGVAGPSRQLSYSFDQSPTHPKFREEERIVTEGTEEQEEQESEHNSSTNTVINNNSDQGEEEADDQLVIMVEAIKGKWTRLQENVRDLTTDSLESLAVPRTIDELETNLEMLDKYQEMMELIINELTTNDLANLATYNSEYRTLNKSIKDLRINLKSSLRKKREAKEEADRKRNEQSGGGGGNGNGNTQSTIRLPRLELPKFDGKPESWLNFKDLFKSSVMDQTIADAQKLQMLKSLLEPGPALDTIKHIPTVGTNLQRAWAALTDKFDNERQLKKLYLDKIRNLREVNSPAGLQKLFDIANDSREALKGLNMDITAMDPMFLHAVVNCFDRETRKMYEILTASAKNANAAYVENWSTLGEFIRIQTNALDKQNKPGNSHSSPVKKSTFLTTAEKKSCSICNKNNHWSSQCNQLKQMDTKRLQDLVREKRLCYKCLGTGHTIWDCKLKYGCKKCKKLHHTALHRDTQSEKSTEKVQASTHLSMKPQCNSTVLLPTAVILVTSITGEKVPMRALLDSGSQTTFVTESAVNALGLKKKGSNMEILGIGGERAQRTKGSVELMITSRINKEFEVITMAHVLPKITGWQPSSAVMRGEWAHLGNLPLADPRYDTPSKIDILLGADIALISLKGKTIMGQSDEPIALASEFGYIVSGRVIPRPTNSYCNLVVPQDNISEILEKFWKLEEVPKKPILTSEEERCEEIFRETTTRAPDGKFVVVMPFKEGGPQLGTSKPMAVKRLQGQENRLARAPELREQYCLFMKEYVDNLHMEEVKEESPKDYYLPHHAVVRQSALTTKLRVVFDGSAKTTNGKSLNTEQLNGPVIQDDLVSIMIRFRQYKVAINGDISKMYRQIWIREDQRDLQRIVWRSEPQNQVQSFRLKTVTYGTKNAPWLACRCLKEIANQIRETNPVASKVIEKSFYMDDVLHGADSSQQAIKLQEEITKILMNYGFPLRKWNSNQEMVISAIKNDSGVDFMTNPEAVAKTLGIRWQKTTDCFSFTVNLNPVAPQTKRQLLSEVAKIFDPLGWAQPIIISAKILLQSLWKLGLDWDESMPEETIQKWNRFRQELPQLENISIPRWMGTLSNSVIELHGFADSSEKAYAAVVYLRIITNQVVKTALIASKTRVCPVKIVTLPRLELCAAVLLARLVEHVKEALEKPELKVTCWSDSTITLGWIYSEPQKYGTFVSNRISEINSIVPRNQWHHIRSEENPADVASRGIMPGQLGCHSMWFSGPEFLLGDYTQKFGLVIDEPQVEMKKTKTALIATDDNNVDWLIYRYSSMKKLLGVTALMRRWANNHKNKLKVKGEVSGAERSAAFHYLCSKIQEQQFPVEYKVKGNPQKFPKKSKLRDLCPIWDEKLQLLRVGGRLRNAELHWEQKHPIIIGNCHFVQLYLRQLHVENLHAEVSLLVATARQELWILRARNAAKAAIKQCIICTRFKAKTYEQIMSNLPKARVEGIFPFYNTGVDYCGPIEIKTRTGRGGSKYKGWIAVFTCLATRATHLEAVTSLSTEGFIAALRRFVGRRGKPAHIYCDNGTNFVGGQKELKGLMSEEELQQHEPFPGLKFHFNPPSAPHFGGSWESTVKSAKFHLKRVMNDRAFTYEELATVLTSIEACLNSRPLGKLNDDPSDLSVLSPGHFLIGRPINTVPDPDVQQLKENSLSRYQLCQKIVQTFWQKWRNEYLTSMQQRVKWTEEHTNAKEGDCVIIKEDNLPPTAWKIAVIEKVFPGKDGKVRMATVRTNKGSYDRPVVKLVPLGFDTVCQGRGDVCASKEIEEEEKL